MNCVSFNLTLYVPCIILQCGHILRRNCLLKQVIEGKIKGEMGVTRRWERRCKKLLDDLKDSRGYSHLKEEALDLSSDRLLNKIRC